jgi:hypothetical protein
LDSETHALDGDKCFLDSETHVLDGDKCFLDSETHALDVKTRLQIALHIAQGNFLIFEIPYFIFSLLIDDFN